MPKLNKGWPLGFDIRAMGKSILGLDLAKRLKESQRNRAMITGYCGYVLDASLPPHRTINAAKTREGERDE
jgi:hypothetical protein